MGLSIGYIGLSLFISLALIFGTTRATKVSQIHPPVRILPVLIIWHIYLYLLSLTGFIADLSFPPRFVLLTIIPAFLFIVWFSLRVRKSKWINGMEPHWLIFFQVFRVFLELLFLWTVKEGILHPNVTLEGYNYDMVFAFTSLPIGWFVIRGHYKAGLLWNYVGLIIIASIIFLFQTTIYLPEMYGPDTPLFPVAFFQYPYMLVPAFLMPTAVFIHILSIIQLHRKVRKR